MEKGKEKKIELKRIVLFLLISVLFSALAQAQTVSPSNAGPLKSTSLYAPEDAAAGGLYEYTDIQTTGISSRIKAFNLTGTGGGALNSSTVAIGPYYPSGTLGDGNHVM
ncbi:MAG: hypothetical protein LBU51_11495, partial [Bacteroidales bacterium]|nr:hypothetical protein [Bacteroidales bacterium]